MLLSGGHFRKVKRGCDKITENSHVPINHINKGRLQKKEQKEKQCIGKLTNDILRKLF